MYSGLSWLPTPPPDFREQCVSLTKNKADLGQSVRTLASYSLDENQLNRIAKIVKQAQRSGISLAPMTPFRLGVIGNGTLEFLIPALIASAARHGVALECISGDYDQTIQEALSPSSRINTAQCDAVLIALDYRGLPLRFSPGNREASNSSIEASLDYLSSIRQGIGQNGKTICIVQTVAQPPEALFGSADRLMPGTIRYAIEQLNQRISASLVDTHDLLLDVATLAETVGLAEWHDPSQWNMAKIPFASAFIPLYADHVARLLAALRGKSRRCLILDLDNTLWGGIIGDDGHAGIKIAQGDATGEAFLSVQRWALSLRERGIVLAVSSKNNDEIARSVFQTHPDMLLRENHIAVFQANWNDKATNIKAIAEELSLGLDAMVFLDDNPVERGLVRQILPQVAVPELPDDPALYARTLAAAGYFESTAFSKEDGQRADFYQDNARRVTLKKQAGDVNSYLASLGMEIIFQPFEAVGRTRITQLINKSNQFNLTTRRYTEADIAVIEDDSTCFTLQVRLTDTFGDNGMISVIICRNLGDAIWEIDTWLMSCRVLKRGVEQMVLREILQHARAAGVHKLIGIYRPTDRNMMVQNHYPELGFTPLGSRPDGQTKWEMPTETEVAAAPMTCTRLGFDPIKK